MPWIQNISYSDVKKGFHIDPGQNAMMINIVDPDMDFPEPKYSFKEIHRFKFLDLEHSDECINDAWKIQDQQAAQLVELLQHAKENRMNVIVSCVAGVCRSGAVAEVGVMLGFDDAEAFRSPNLLVKHKMLRALGWYYNENEAHTINGINLDEDWTNDNEKVFLLAHARRMHRERHNKE
jgi:hypothetical protein